MPAAHKMRRPADFAATLTGGRQGCNLVVAYAARRSDERRLVGYIVSKAVGPSVRRHKVTRRLRAIMASQLGAVPAGTSVVIRALPASAQASYPTLQRAVTKTVDRAMRKAVDK